MEPFTANSVSQQKGESCMAHNPKIDAYVKRFAGEKKISLVINKVQVSEIKPIMDFIAELRAKK